MLETDRWYRRLLESEAGKQLGEDVCQALCETGHIEHVTAGKEIFQEGQAARAFYILLEGGLKIIRSSEDGREVIFHLAHPVRIIAEAALFLGRYPATAVTTEASVLLKLPIEGVQRLMDQHPVLLRWMFDAMGSWLRRLLEIIDRLNTPDATARLVRYLLDHGERSGEGDQLALSVKKGDLATLLNMNQATLSRSLRRLREDDLIEVNGRQLTLLDRRALERIADPPME